MNADLKTLPFADLEAVYDDIATAIDQAGAERRELFLAKLALALSHFVGDRARVGEAIAVALRDLDGPAMPAATA